MNIQPSLLTLDGLLSQRLFRIPEYQRSYSWGKKQREELFSDIEKLQGSTDPHFMATIVGLKREVRDILTSNFQVVEVVDGQQRLTTLIILLKAIQKALNPDDHSEKFIADGLQQLLVKPDALSLVLLQTNHDACQYCVTYLRTGARPAPSEAKTVADRHLLDAMDECERFIKRWKQKQSLTDLLQLVKNRLVFILHEIDNEKIVYTVFEVLNSRGLDVSWFDRLKSMLMGLAFESGSGGSQETIGELHRLWCDIYRIIGLHQGLNTETLKFAATLYSTNIPSKMLSEEDSVTLLRRKAQEAPGGVVTVTEWILTVVTAVDQLSADRRRDGVTRIAQARLLATSILVRSDLTDAEREHLMGLWERISFRIYGMYQKDARTKVGDYVRLAWRIAKEKPTAEEIESALKGLGADHPIDGAIALLRGANCYTDWQTELRYLLFRYEEHLARKKGQTFNNEQWSRIWETTAAESIEHIAPQRYDYSYIHRLGNLMLLPPRLNSKLKDQAPSKKAGAYRETGMFQASDVASRLDQKWDLEAVVKREDELLTWAAEHWKD